MKSVVVDRLNIDQTCRKVSNEYSKVKINKKNTANIIIHTLSYIRYHTYIHSYLHACLYTYSYKHTYYIYTFSSIITIASLSSLPVTKKGSLYLDPR